MSGTYVVQTQTRAAGNTGHVSDHDNLGAVLAANSYITGNVLNTAYSGGADPTGTNDCTAAFQACLNALAASGGGVMYIPTGTYIQDGAVTWTSANALTIIGDGPGATVISQNSTNAPMTYCAVSNSSHLAVRDIKFNNNANAPSFSSTNVSFQCTSVTWGAWYNVVWQGGQRVNQCVVLNNCTNFDFGTCDMRSYVNCLVLEGTTACVTVHDGSFAQNSGSGVSTAASILMTGNPATLHVTNQVFNSGDRGLLCTAGTGANPAFVWMYDAELNNMSICGLQFDTGCEVWITATYIVSNTANQCVYFGSAFQGVAYLSQCVFEGATQHSVVLSGGTGYSITDCVFGENGAGKAAANTWDEVNIQSSVNYVIIQGNHFNTDPYYGLGTTPPRSAVNCNSATNCQVYGNVSEPNSSYGNKALMATSSNYAVQAVNMPSTYDLEAPVSGRYEEISPNADIEHD